MELVGYPLVLGLGTVYFTNRYLYKKYFNPVRAVNPFKKMLESSDSYSKKNMFTSRKKYWANKTLLLDIDGEDIVDSTLLEDDDLKMF